MAEQFPTIRPDTPVLDKVDEGLQYLRELGEDDLLQLARELRQ